MSSFVLHCPAVLSVSNLSTLYLRLLSQLARQRLKVQAVRATRWKENLCLSPVR